MFATRSIQYVVKSTKASVVIPKVDRIFATHSIQYVVKTDGSPFKGEEYSRYLKALGIKAKFSIPIWPKGNAEAERFMRPRGKTLKTARIENPHGDKNSTDSCHNTV